MSSEKANEMELYIATLRVFVYDHSEVEAAITVDECIDLVEDYLEPEDGDRVELTQLTPFRTDVEPSELLVIILRARNALVRTRIKECWDLARSIDQLAHSLKYRDTSGMLPSYDYGTFIEVAKRILTHNEDPL